VTQNRQNVPQNRQGEEIFASLSKHAAEIIYLPGMIIQMKQQLQQYGAGRSFRFVENHWVLNLHMLRRVRVHRFHARLA
jgi:hypothetical protein